jgi:hypothetical protein
MNGHIHRRARKRVNLSRVRIFIPIHQADPGGIMTVVRGLAGALPAALGASDDLVLYGDPTRQRHGEDGGDVPWLFNEILPRLRSGVVVHVHDVFLPGDYPQEWVLDGWG